LSALLHPDQPLWPVPSGREAEGSRWVWDPPFRATRPLAARAVPESMALRRGRSASGSRTRRSWCCALW